MRKITIFRRTKATPANSRNYISRGKQIILKTFFCCCFDNNIHGGKIVSTDKMKFCTNINSTEENDDIFFVPDFVVFFCFSPLFLKRKGPEY